MDEYDVYRLYVALKSHFRKKSYDYFKHGGAIKASPKAYNDRNDKYFFHKLAKRSDVFGFLVANFAHNAEHWIGDFEKAEKIYLKWLGKIPALGYNLRYELQELARKGSLLDLVKVVPGEVPKVFVAYLNGKLSLESLVILIDCLRLHSYWDKELKDDIIWSDLSMLTKKYKPFLKYNRDDMKKIIKEVYSENSGD